MKKVLSISSKGKFLQYLMLSEARLISQMCDAFGEITVTMVSISIASYKAAFGK